MKKTLDFIKKYKAILKIVLFICIITAIAVVFIKVFFIPTIVVSNSMYPALNEDDVLFIDSLNKNYNKIERFDIILFYDKYNINTNIIKRVIGLPGDKVEIIDNVIYINDEILYEYYGYYDDTAESRYSNVAPVKLAFDEYFVMGDNRNVSEDSRSEEIGVVNRENIIGIAVFRLWPLNSFGSLENQ